MMKIFYFLQGWFRYYLYYSKELLHINLKWLMRKHIVEQIEYRFRSIKQVCFEQGSCQKCGCHTAALIMSDPSCQGNCYPEMLSSFAWNIVKTSPESVWNTLGTGVWNTQQGRFINYYNRDRRKV